MANHPPENTLSNAHFLLYATDQSGCFTSDNARYSVQDTLNHAVVLTVGQRINVAITPADQFPVGNASGNLAVSVGHGIPAAELGVQHISTVKMDDTALAQGPGADYTIADGGSVLITLHQSHLNTLPAGAHTLSVAIGSGNYGGVTVATGITVLPVAMPGTVPQTGDDAQPWLWMALAVGAVLAIGFVLWRKRRGR